MNQEHHYLQSCSVFPFCAAILPDPCSWNFRYQLHLHLQSSCVCQPLLEVAQLRSSASIVILVGRLLRPPILFGLGLSPYSLSAS
jgi:hypothetical protein